MPCRLLFLFGSAKHCVRIFVLSLQIIEGDIVTCPAGCCFLFGGVKYRVQEFNATLNKACCSLLLLACIGIIIPSSAQQLFGPDRMPDQALANISHAIAICLGLV